VAKRIGKGSDARRLETGLETRLEAMVCASAERSTGAAQRQLPDTKMVCASTVGALNQDRSIAEAVSAALSSDLCDPHSLSQTCPADLASTLRLVSAQRLQTASGVSATSPVARPPFALLERTADLSGMSSGKTNAPASPCLGSASVPNMNGLIQAQPVARPFSGTLPSTTRSEVATSATWTRTSASSPSSVSRTIRSARTEVPSVSSQSLKARAEMSGGARAPTAPIRPVVGAYPKMVPTTVLSPRGAPTASQAYSAVAARAARCMEAPGNLRQHPPFPPTGS